MSYITIYELRYMNCSLSSCITQWKWMCSCLFFCKVNDYTYTWLKQQSQYYHRWYILQTSREDLCVLMFCVRCWMSSALSTNHSLRHCCWHIALCVCVFSENHAKLVLWQSWKELCALCVSLCVYTFSSLFVSLFRFLCLSYA